jgi:ABC-type cobalt transport system substrate-binding protein
MNRTKQIAIIIFIISGLFFIAFSVFSKGNWGGADSYVHYRISRYAFKYPHLFLDLWGKPVFNILSSPFSQFGFTGIKIFNVFIALMTAWFVFDMAGIFKWKARYMSMLMVLYAPIYFIIIPSGLTEPLFGLVLISAVWLFFKDRFISSAIIISLIPFARNEGFVFFPLFLAAFLLKKQYRAIPFLAAGFILFSFAGLPVYKDIFWIINQSGGNGDLGIYGTGPLFHYVRHIDNIMGYPLLLFFIAGLIWSAVRLFRNFRNIGAEHLFFILVIGGFITYFSAHSVVRWLWEGRSLGLIRVIAGIVPLGALVAMRGFDVITQFLPRNRLYSSAFIIVSSAVTISYPFFKYPVPVGLNDEEKLIRICCEWIVDENYDNRLIYFYDPLIPHYLGKDPFDYRQVHELVDDRENPQNGIPPGSIVIWDAHFGPNEGQLPLERLLNNDSFIHLAEFTPEHPFKTLNGYDYEIFVFLRK